MNPTNKDIIITWLSKNQEAILEAISEHTKQKARLLKTEPVEFHDDILNDYDNIARFVIVWEIGKSTGIAVDNIEEVLEDLNIRDYLNSEYN